MDRRLYNGIPAKAKTSFNLIAPNVNKEITVNAFGFYDSKINNNKQRGYYRIAVLGNSYETGHFSESVKSYPELCDDIFKNESHKVECLNFSIDGEYGDWYRIRLIENKILKFDPDLIILNVKMPFSNQIVVKEHYKGIVIEYEQNDEQSRIGLKKKIDEIATIKPFTVLFDLSFLFRGFCVLMVQKKENIGNRNNGFWEKIEIYRTRKLSADNLYKREFSELESVDIVNRLFINLGEQDVELCLLDNNSLDKSLLNENIRYLKLNSYGGEKFSSSVNGDSFDKNETIMLAWELYETLIETYIPANYIDNK